MNSSADVVFLKISGFTVRISCLEEFMVKAVKVGGYCTLLGTSISLAILSR